MIASSVSVANKKFSEQENAPPSSSNTPSSTSAVAAAISKQSTAELAPEEKKRGKRMMGVLMGTLSKFKSEEVDKSEANLKRILLEQKLAQKLQSAKAAVTAEITGITETERCVTIGNDSTSAMNDITMHDTTSIIQDIKRVCYPSQSTENYQRTETHPVLFFKRAN